MIQASMQRGPLARRLILSGPADDFQRSELVRHPRRNAGRARRPLGPGLAAAGTEDRPMIPLAIEAQLLGLAGFATGLVIWLMSSNCRRRANLWKKRI